LEHRNNGIILDDWELTIQQVPQNSWLGAGSIHLKTECGRCNTIPFTVQVGGTAVEAGNNFTRVCGSRTG